MNLQSKKTRSIITQVLVLLAVIGGFSYFVNNAIINLNKLGIASGFDFLFTQSGYDLYSPFLEYTSESYHIEAFYVGILNTLLVSILGIFLATVLGFLMGVIRLSDNWIASSTVYAIVEFTRNVPVLIWIVIWYFGVFLQLPSPRNGAINIMDMAFISNRGLYVPAPVFQPLFWGVFIAFVVGIVLTVLYNRKAKIKKDETGQESPVWTVGLLSIIGLPVIVYYALGAPLEWSIPVLKGFNYKQGMALKPEFVSLLMGLSVYTAASIAEIVRAGILSVDKGQHEAAKSLNLTKSQTMKMIIIPQALRVIIPPLNSQYLNLAKNSSLAMAIGYVDVVSTIGGITLNQTGQAIECIAIVMITYLTLSLLISMIMNYINKRVQIVER